MIDRRTLLGGAALSVLASSRPPQARAAEAPLRIASVKFGSLGWLLETIRAEGLDKKHGLTLEIVEVANNQAGPVALLSDGADLIVSDWPWAMRQRGLGEAVRFSPFSSALGAVIVPKESPIKTLADIEGKKLGVAGSSIDKSWLLLRAYSKKTLGKDISEIAEASFGAAPLLAEEIKSGRIDAVLNFWTYGARLKGAGFVPILTMKEIMASFGIEPVPALVGFIWKEGYAAANGAKVEGFLKAAAEANAVLAASDPAWERLRAMMKVTAEEEFQALKAGYRGGIPGAWTAAETTAAQKLMALLIEAGDQELVGHGTKFDAKLFHAAG